MGEFRIVYFDEVDDPYKISLMFQLSLWSSMMPKVLREIREHDDRYTPEFGIFAITREGTVAAGHLLMQITTETVEGMLEVGGVNAVGTRPDFARRGFMTAIMEASHEYFRERGLPLSALTTSNRLGAAIMYGRLGYREIVCDTMCVKHPNQPRSHTSPDLSVRAFRDDDVRGIYEVYRESVSESYGFIQRPTNFLQARKYSAGELKPKDNMRIAERGGKVVGYAYWDSNPRVSECHEILAADQSSFHALLADAELRNPEAGILILSTGLTEREFGWLRAANFQGPLKGYGSLVMKDLKRKTRPAELKRLYGVGAGSFRLGTWDGT